MDTFRAMAAFAVSFTIGLPLAVWLVFEGSAAFGIGDGGFGDLVWLLPASLIGAIVFALIGTGLIEKFWSPSKDESE
ncbi:hypothetical protein MUO32_08520 [Shinella sp. CPCC 101442]|uniref:hypothetical protein n=1 Tax=Shinella sp. CPCC 101442 TaxID=2932265 RepID=UPI002152486F|nr:hypothetical protein [Shinella sp. CPCC 101442]MCR6499072.1 hypothetical protein [Shinella sp. CPCC 101442]